jgi:adenosine deaminase
MVIESARSWFERVPKVELHIHLEGAIPLDALWELMQKYGGDPGVPDRAALEKKFLYTDFMHFIQTWIWKNTFLREYADFEFMAEAVARDLLAQNILYVEAYYSPPDHTRHGSLETVRLTEAIRKGLDRVPGIEVKLIADLVRDFGAQKGFRTLDEVNEARGFGVIGIGIGGTEYEYPPELFREVYARARLLGFRTTAHAGEVAGAESVWGVVRDLQADRIGHGTHAMSDPELVKLLAKKQIPVEMCPLSNLRTGSVKTLEEHPIRRFFDERLLVTVNTDDPKMFNNSMAEEFEALTLVHRFTHDEIRKLILNGVESSWLEPEKKRLLKSDFVNDPNWKR